MRPASSRSHVSRRCASTMPAPAPSWSARCAPGWSTDAKAESAATALGVHRHTLRSRIAQAGGLLDIDLSTFPARAELWTLLQTARETDLARLADDQRGAGGLPAPRCPNSSPTAIRSPVDRSHSRPHPPDGAPAIRNPGQPSAQLPQPPAQPRKTARTAPPAPPTQSPSPGERPHRRSLRPPPPSRPKSHGVAVHRNAHRLVPSPDSRSSSATLTQKTAAL